VLKPDAGRLGNVGERYARCTGSFRGELLRHCSEVQEQTCEKKATRPAPDEQTARRHEPRRQCGLSV